ncbi:MAG: hypothetical protein ACRC1W_13260 [Shewanella sp.]
MEIIFKFLKRYNELWLAPLGLLVWLISPSLIRFLDSEAAVYDTAVFQKLIFGLVTFSFCTFNVWIVLKLTMPKVFRYLTEVFDEDFETLNQNQKWEKLKLSFAVFACYLLGLLLAMQVL